jgi:hypothetical protein
MQSNDIARSTLPWVILPAALVAAGTVFLYKGVGEAHVGPPPFSLHSTAPSFAWAVALGAVGAFARLGWAWKSGRQWWALGAAAAGLVATIALTGGVFDVYSQAESCPQGTQCDSAPFQATADNAMIALTFSLAAAAAATLITLVCIEDLARKSSSGSS